DEAGRARDRGVLLPVTLDEVSPPAGFGLIQTLDLVGWVDDTNDSRFGVVVNAARAVASGVSQPRPLLRITKARRRAGAIAIVLAALGIFVDSKAVARVACRVPGARSVCAVFGVG